LTSLNCHATGDDQDRGGGVENHDPVLGASGGDHSPDQVEADQRSDSAGNQDEAQLGRCHGKARFNQRHAGEQRCPCGTHKKKENYNAAVPVFNLAVVEFGH